MATKDKKIPVPDVGSLLGIIAKKRDELPKTDIQHIQPVPPADDSTVNTELEGKNGKTEKQKSGEPRGIGGRPSMKRDNVEYTKISPRIPKALKKQVEYALVEERFSRKADGQHIKTLDEIGELALERLLATK